MIDALKGAALIAAFIGFLTIFAMWVSLWDNVWRVVTPTLATAGQFERSLYRLASRGDVIDRANESSPAHLAGPRPNPCLNLSVDARKKDTNEPPYPLNLGAGLTTISEISR
jgi:hypothetical protein